MNFDSLQIYDLREEHEKSLCQLQHQRAILQADKARLEAEADQARAAEGDAAEDAAAAREEAMEAAAAARRAEAAKDQVLFNFAPAQVPKPQHS